MKHILLFMILVIIAISCKEKSTSAPELEKSRSLGIQKSTKAEVNFDSNPVGTRYKSVISEKYNDLDINFAAYYVVITWGCGSGCVTGAMVDTRDGTVYAMPEDKEWGGNGTSIETRKESNTLQSILAIQTPAGKIEETRKYWEWNEDLKEFGLIKLESNDPLHEE